MYAFFTPPPQLACPEAIVTWSAMCHPQASRYSRYDPDRRSRSPRDRSPDRFDRGPPYDQDRRRSSAESRGNPGGFPPNRDSFGDSMRRDPPRGPKALIDLPSGPRGGFGGDFRGGRGRGRGRPWPARDDSRERGRDRDIDFRERYRDERSRDRERDRDRDRDWRDRDYARRRSPIGRPRSPNRDFRDRDRDALPPVDVDRPRRGSRDGGPPSAGSAASDSQFNGPPFARGGGFMRGRGRGGRGDWGPDRGRGRTPYDDRSDRYPRSRSQEGRWGRERDDRDRGDRYPDDSRRDIRDDRDRPDRDHLRGKSDVRTPNPAESAPQSRDVSPPPVAPSAPAFGSVPNRGSISIDGAGKPPSMPRAHSDRPPSSGHLGPESPSLSLRGPPPASGRHFNRRMPDSPKAMRSQTFTYTGDHPEQRRPRSSGANSDSVTGTDNRSRSNYSAEPGEIVKSENEMQDPKQSAADLDEGELPSDEKLSAQKLDAKHVPPKNTRKRKRPAVGVVRFALPSKTSKDDDSESDDDEDMADYFDMEISKTESELSKLQKPELPLEVLARYASLSHGSMVKILNDGEGLTEMLGEPPEGIALATTKEEEPMSKPSEERTAETEPRRKQEEKLTNTADVPTTTKVEEMPVPPVAEIPEIKTSQKEPEPDLEPQPDEVPESEPEPGQKSQAEREPVPQLVPQPVLKPVPEPVPESVPEPVTERESEPARESMPDPVPEPEPEPEPEREREPSPNPNAEPEPEPKSAESEPQSRPELAREPELKPEPELEQTATVVPLVTEAADKLTKEPEIQPQLEVNGNLQTTDPELQETKLPDPPVPMEITETGSKVPSTPSQVEDDETESEDDTYLDVDAIRQYMTTPPPESLPNFATKPWEKDTDFLATLDADPAIDSYVAQHMSKVHLDRDQEQNEQRHVYADNYIRYLDFTTSSDPVAVKSRDKFSVTMPIPEPATAATPEPKPEGRTSGRRFASERDLERVLQASMREDEERKERELRIQKEKYRSEKEADIPSMYWDAEERQTVQYWDHSGYVPQDRLVSAWQVLAPVNNFTKEEAELFEKRYLEHPKQWGKIAEVIPNRDFGTCIQYYYLMKKDLNLKEKLKKQPKRRKKGRGKQRSSALMSELGNADPETEDNQETGENGERRRPRRAAAPTWGFEQPPIDPDTSTPASTPGRRGRGEQGEKADGRRRGRKSAKEKEKEAKEKKANQSLSAASTPGPSKGRPRSSSRMPEGPAPVPNEIHPAVPNFEQAIPSGIQPPFSVHSQPMTGVERQQTPVAPPPVAEVLSAPSLRPEPPPPPPQPAMATFNLAQSNQDRKAATQASSYWSVSESNDFPLLLAAFGSDWTAIANHMGSKTAVMVKNYFVRQKDQTKPELEAIVNDADAKRSRGEKRPDPPMPTTGGRGRRYDVLPPAPGRPGPFGVPQGMEMHNEPPPPAKQDAGQPGRAPGYPAYGVPIAKAPPAQGLGPPAGQPVGAQAAPPAVGPPLSPSRTGRGPPPAFGFPDRERDVRGPLAPKGPVAGSPDVRDQRALHERQKADMALRDTHMRDRERERDLVRQPMHVKQEEMPPQHAGYEPFGHRQQPSLGQIRNDPLSLGRPATTEPPRNYTQGPQPGRGLLGDPGPGQSPPMARPMSTTMGSRPPSGELYPPHPPPQSRTPVPTGGLAKPSEPRKTSNIMSLLNDDPPPAPKRVTEVAARAVATPPPQPMPRAPPAQQQPAAPLRREPEPAYHAYGRNPPPAAAPAGMPSLKPSQPPPMPGSRMAMEAQPERDYYRPHVYPSVQQNTATNSPPTAPHRYAPPPSQAYQPQPGYPAQYGSAPPPHAASPPPQYAGHAAPRGRDHGPPPPQTVRDSGWPTHQQPPGNSWQQAPGPKTSQGPPPQQSWSPAPQSQPPPHPHAVRDERGYGAQQMQSRYAPPPATTRPPDPGPPPPAPYNRYSSTPVPRDPREMPGRSYTPGYDTRGPPAPPQGPSGYPGPDPRDARDPRDMMSRGLRPQEYDRRQDQYRR
ncbi:hypothetical protein V2A60_001604 [Cordyceps javanica]|uniref:Myb-like DNA-binding protein n=1 Tax=Cordyceps javanica TaxID=43265 RepID=A0A545VFM1_9HYPO|nr:Myb-like DNA-binding protein [Cordyceps javanica]TQW11710.1 Myb-like DNA-binding protein [Cordyceps javanica]